MIYLYFPSTGIYWLGQFYEHLCIIKHLKHLLGILFITPLINHQHIISPFRNPLLTIVFSTHNHTHSFIFYNDKISFKKPTISTKIPKNSETLMKDIIKHNKSLKTKFAFKIWKDKWKNIWIAQTDRQIDR